MHVKCVLCLLLSSLQQPSAAEYKPNIFRTQEGDAFENKGYECHLFNGRDYSDAFKGCRCRRSSEKGTLGSNNNKITCLYMTDAFNECTAYVEGFEKSPNHIPNELDWYKQRAAIMHCETPEVTSCERWQDGVYVPFNKSFSASDTGDLIWAEMPKDFLSEYNGHLFKINLTCGGVQEKCLRLKFHGSTVQTIPESMLPNRTEQTTTTTSLISTDASSTHPTTPTATIVTTAVTTKGVTPTTQGTIPTTQKPPAGMEVGAILGIVVGILVIVCICLLLLFCRYKRKCIFAKEKDSNGKGISRKKRAVSNRYSDSNTISSGRSKQTVGGGDIYLEPVVKTKLNKQASAIWYYEQPVPQNEGIYQGVSALSTPNINISPASVIVNDNNNTPVPNQHVDNNAEEIYSRVTPLPLRRNSVLSNRQYIQDDDDMAWSDGEFDDVMPANTLPPQGRNRSWWSEDKEKLAKKKSSNKLLKMDPSVWSDTRRPPPNFEKRHSAKDTPKYVAKSPSGPILPPRNASNSSLKSINTPNPLNSPITNQPVSPAGSLNSPVSTTGPVNSTVSPSKAKPEPPPRRQSNAVSPRLPSNPMPHPRSTISSGPATKRPDSFSISEIYDRPEQPDSVDRTNYVLYSSPFTMKRNQRPSDKQIHADNQKQTENRRYFNNQNHSDSQRPTGNLGRTHNFSCQKQPDSLVSQSNLLNKASQVHYQAANRTPRKPYHDLDREYVPATYASLQNNI